MKKKFFKVVSMMLTVALIGTSVNLTALAKESDSMPDDSAVAASEAAIDAEDDMEENGASVISNPRKSGDVVTWDCVVFGEYWQNDTNGDGNVNNSDDKETIKWRVLNVTGDDAFLLADQALDCKPFNTTEKSVTWNDCTLKNWLNGEFYNTAFNSAEKEAINKTTVVNDNNIENNTTENIYLLSTDEASNEAYGFYNGDSDWYTRISKPTQYALANGVRASIDENCRGNCNWWLRSKREGNNAAIVDETCVDGGALVNSSGFGVRPVLHLNLKYTYLWSHVGTVDSAGNVNFKEPVFEYPEYQIAFDANGGTCDNSYKSVQYKSVYGELPVAKREGYTFLGWFTDKEAGALVEADTVVDKMENHTLYARWRENGMLNSPVIKDGVTTWDCVYFGNYWQNDTNGDGKADIYDAKEPIKWRVLYVDGDDAFLLADQALEEKQYHTDDTLGVTWETCALRAWLNEDFYNTAFDSTEQAAIKTTEVVNNDNPLNGAPGGNKTSDKIYLLNNEEALDSSYGFSENYIIGEVASESDNARRCKSTCYVLDSYSHSNYEVYCKWITRSISYYYSMGYGRLYSGGVDTNGLVKYKFAKADVAYAVRPTLHLNLKSSSVWWYAGTVDSEDNTTPTYPEAIVTFDPRGGNCDIEDKTVTFKSEYGDLPVPTLSGYTFTGWFTEMENGELVNADKVVSRLGDHTLYARWRGKGNVHSPVSNGDVVTWNCVYFGNYWQNDTNGSGIADTDDSKEPIKWRVLYVDGDDAFLLSDQALDCKQYNTEEVDVTWETCTLRSWLNEDFYNEAFNSTEQSAINTTTVVNNDNPKYDTEGGNNTSDKIYLLSIEESLKSSYGFSTAYSEYDKVKRCKPTQYAIDNGASTSKITEYLGNCWWWLRSPGGDSTHAALVLGDGYVYRAGYGVLDSHGAVRPALHLNLKSSSTWSYVGTVDSDGNVDFVNPEPTVILDTNGGSCGQSETIVSYRSEYGELPVATRTGYTFLGWFTEKEAGEEVKADTVVRKPVNHTLYAHWKAGDYEITFDANGGNCDKKEITVSFNGIYGELPVPVKKCGIFLGWFTEKEAGTLVAADTVVKTAENHTLYAHWSANHSEVEDAAVAPTCTEKGKTAGSHCSVCKEVLEEQKEVKAKGHTVVEDKEVASTCTEKGKTAGSHCSVCGEVFKAQEEIKAPGHSFDEGVVTKEPTYDEDGIKTYTCTICKKTEERKIEKIEKPAETIVIGDTEYTIAIEVRDTEGNILTGIDMSDKITVKGKKVVLAKAKSMKLTGYTFKGWKLDGKKITSIKTANVTDNMTLVAEFAENTYDIIYKITKPAKGVKVKGKIPTLKKNKYTEEVTLSDGSELTVKGYKLAGWTTVKKSTEVQYKPGENVSELTDKNKGKKVLYPVWEKAE